MAVLDLVHGKLVHGRRVRVLADHLTAMLDDVPAGARVLDVGCGDGLLAAVIGQRRPDLALSGCDVLVRDQTHVPVEAFDGATLPHPDDTFAAALLVDVLHHTDDPPALLAEVARVARIVLVKDHLRQGLLAFTTLRFMDWVGNARHGVALPYNYLAPADWDAAFAACGVAPTREVRQLGLYPWYANWCFGRGLHFVARLEAAASS